MLGASGLLANARPKDPLLNLGDDELPVTTPLRTVFAPLLVALSFLTLLPVGIPNPADREISRSRGWYPAVGLCYGLLLTAIAALCGLLGIAPLLTAALLVAALAIGNRFLHLDGLMDVCDGILGGQTPARRLEIMRDSRVGAFAVAGAACILLVKSAALATLLDAETHAADHPAVWPILLLFPTASRWTMTLLLTAFPYGRPHGIGAPFAAARRPWLPTLLALLTASAVAIAAAGPAGLAILAGASALALLFGYWATRQLDGGLTGDCYGAANEITETAALIAIAAIAPHPWFAPLGFAPL